MQLLGDILVGVLGILSRKRFVRVPAHHDNAPAHTRFIRDLLFLLVFIALLVSVLPLCTVTLIVLGWESLSLGLLEWIYVGLFLIIFVLNVVIMVWSRRPTKNDGAIVAAIGMVISANAGSWIYCLNYPYLSVLLDVALVMCLVAFLIFGLFYLNFLRKAKAYKIHRFTFDQQWHSTIMSRDPIKEPDFLQVMDRSSPQPQNSGFDTTNQNS